MNGFSPKKHAVRTLSHFVIIGPGNLQNNLLARFVEKHLETPCTVSMWTDLLVAKPSPAEEILALIDMGTTPTETLQNQLLAAHDRIAAIALLNAEPDLHSEWVVRWPKVKGLFYRDTSEQQLIKGLQALRNNEYWLPRKILTESLERTRSMQIKPLEDCCTLTKREREILLALGSGACNTEIARQLNLSPHTIKTHIYNLFKKIEVSNRVQAVSWAVSHLQPPAHA